MILADTLFGDILGDQAGTIAGSFGMLSPACPRGLPVREARVAGLYEAVHGSAMPLRITGNLYAMVVAMAGKASDMILGRDALPAVVNES